VTDNLTGLWRANGKRVPFAAQRATWRAFVVVVTAVEPRHPSDCYAVVRGRLVAIGAKPVEAGKDAEHVIDCAGCYQWNPVEMPDPKVGEIDPPKVAEKSTTRGP
jgi:hypothetical protein